jgi:hypothetical protein
MPLLLTLPMKWPEPSHASSRPTMTISKTLSMLRQAHASRPRILNLVRGVNSKERHLRGLLELQHPWHFEVPWGQEIVSQLCNQPAGEIRGAEERVFRTIVGNTWMFRKSSEFIAWSHFISGKIDSHSGRQIVAPAGVSRGSLKIALDSLVDRQNIYRAHVSGSGRPLILYSPNPLGFGQDQGHLSPETFGRDSSKCSYRVAGRLIYPTLIPSVDSLFYFSKFSKSELYKSLVLRLRSAELLAIFLEIAGESLALALKNRRSLYDSLQASANKSNDALAKHIPAAKEREFELDEEESYWLESTEAAQAFEAAETARLGLITVRADLLTGKDVLPVTMTALIHRFGIPLLTLDSDLLAALLDQSEKLPPQIRSELLSALPPSGCN